jgi:hypothetical protein
MHNQINRRTALKLGVAATLAVGVSTATLTSVAAKPARRTPIEPAAGSWTLFLPSVTRVRLSGPARQQRRALAGAWHGRTC